MARFRARLGSAALFYGDGREEERVVAGGGFVFMGEAKLKRRHRARFFIGAADERLVNADRVARNGGSIGHALVPYGGSIGPMSWVDCRGVTGLGLDSVGTAFATELQSFL